METDIPLRDVMVREVVQGDKELNVRDAAKMMKRYGVDVIVVLKREENGGAESQWDIMRRVVR